MRHAAWLLRDDGCADGDFLSISPFPARLQNTEHFIADAQILDAFAHRTHHAGEIAAQDQGKLLLTVVASAHLPVGAVDACGKRVDDNLTWSSGRVGKIAVFDNLRPAELFNVDSLHGMLVLCKKR